MPQKVMRYQIADYLGITPPAGELVYHLMGVGVTKMDESPSPKTNTDAYVNSKNGVTTVTGYDNSFPYDTQMISDDEAVKALVKVGHDQLIGSDAEFEYVRVDLYDRVGTEGTVYRARKFHVCCEAGDISGDPTDIVQTSGTLHQVGDFTPGTFDVTEKTFTAD